MKEQKKLKQSVLKKDYISPTIEIDFIEMEEGVATGSATTVITNSSGQLQEKDWDTENGGGDIIWQ